MGALVRSLLAFGVIASTACGGGIERRAEAPKPVSASYTLIQAASLPPLAMAARDGSGQLGISAAVATDPGDAATLAGLMRVRLSPRYGSSVSVVPVDGGYRIRLGTASTAALSELQALLLAKVTDAEAREASKEAARLYANAPPQSVVTRCEGRLAASNPVFAGKVEAAALEAARARSHVPARVAFAAIVPGSLVETTAAAWRASRAWPEGAAIAQASVVPAAVPTSGPAIVRTPGREVALRLVVWTPDRERAIAAAEALASDKTALRTRIEAERLRLTMIQATVLPTGGACVVVRAEADPESGARLTAAALGSSPVRFLDELENLVRYTPPVHAPRLRSGDVVDSADELAWWVLSRNGHKGANASREVEITVPEARDGENSAPQAAAAEVAPELVSKVEGGHTAFHVLVGSPCGTLAEGSYNAGLAAWAAHASALDATANGMQTATPLVRAEGIGIHVYDTPSQGETAEELAFRVTSLALRSWFMPDAKATARARRDLVSLLTVPSADLLSRLAQLRAPAHPSWVSPYGTADAVLRLPDGILAQADAGPRGGPLRIAILASEIAQKEAATRAAALWKRTGASKCEAAPQESVRPLPPASAVSDTVLLGIPTKGERRVADIWAKLLSEPAGPLAKAREETGLRRLSVTAEGRDDAKLLVVRLEGASANVQRAEEAVRKALDALRDSALPEGELARGIREAESNAAARLETLFIGGAAAAASPVTPNHLRSFASQFFKSDAIIRTP